MQMQAKIDSIYMTMAENRVLGFGTG